MSEIVRSWLYEFHDSLMKPCESELSDEERALFEVQWSGCREKLSADIEGSMTKSVLECHAKLSNEQKSTVLDEI